MTILALSLSLILLVVAGALRAGAAALVRTPRADALHDAAEGDGGAARVAHLLEDRNRVQPAISVVHASMLVAATIPAAWALSARFSGWPLLGALAALGVAFVLLGELLPRDLGRRHPRRLAYRLSALLGLAIRAGERAADVITDLEDDDDTDEPQEHAEDDRQEIELISSVLEFSDTLVREVMVPRTDMVTIERDRTTDDALDLVVEHGYSRIPVVGEGPDDVIGVVYAKDLLRVMDEGRGSVPVTQIMREPYYVPETKLVPDLLRDMQVNKTHMAIVADEFGGTAGLVTIEDLIEELVGEIVDEHDTEEPLVEEVDGGWIVDGRLSIDDLNALTGFEFPDDEWDTVAGLILELAGRVPLEGEQFEYDGVFLKVERVQGRRVGRVRVAQSSRRRVELEQT